MESLFTKTTVVLTTEYVALFTSRQLSSKLSKVASLTGVQFSKAKEAYALTGSWEQINDAFLLLQNWQDNPGTEPTEYDDISDFGPENTEEKTSDAGKNKKNKTESSQSADCLTATTTVANSESKAEILEAVDDVKPNRNYKKKGKAKLKTVKLETGLLNELSDSKKIPQTSKENKQNVRPQINKFTKTAKKCYKKKVLSELTREHQHKDTNSTLNVVDGQVTDINDQNSLSEIVNTESIDNLNNLANIDVKDSFKENENGSSQSKTINTSCSSMSNDGEKPEKKINRKPGDEGYWSRVKIPDYNEKHKCTKCGVVLKSRKRYMEHLRRIHIKEFKCEVCERRFGYPTDLHRHKCPGISDPDRVQKTKTGRPKKPKPVALPIFLPCPECDYIGTSKKRFNGHVRRTHRLRFPCDQCNKMFGFSRDLQRHKDNVHAETSYFCDKCSKFYKSKSVFDVHMKTHEEGYVKPTYECQVCAKSFTTKYVLASHIKTEHLGMKKIYLCQICGKNFSQRNSYKQHSNAHAGIKPYKCETCGKAFTYHKSLKEHKFMHDNIRRFQCQLCEKAFRQRTTLQIHMKVHKTVKDHICSTCGKGFSQKQALERHERIHTGVKPYTCVPCQRTFGDASTIRRHMIAIHQKDENNWRDDIVCTVKKKTDYYVLGGSGQNRTYKSKSNVGQSAKTMSKEEKKPKPDVKESPVSEASIILLNTQEPCSLDYKNDYSLTDLAALQEQAGQLQSVQPGAIYAVSTSVPQSQPLQPGAIYAVSTSVPHSQPMQYLGQTTSIVNSPLGTINYSSSGGHVLDFSALSQNVSQSQILGEKVPDHMVNQSHLGLQTSCSNMLPNSSLHPVTMATESQRVMPMNGLQSTTTDSTALNQTVGNLWGFMGYQAYYNAAGLQQYQTTQNQ